MLNENTLSGCIQDINGLPFNLKAEIITNLLLDRGMPSENLMIQMNSAFNRPFRRDVEKAQLGMNEEKGRVNLLLSRNGIYDLLPEGVIHERNEGNTREGVQQLIQIHQKQKREEREARIFFKPFENELFRILVKIEQQEVSLLKNQDHQFQSFLVRFWDINPKLEECQKQFLLKLAPLAYSLKGNLDKICKVLQVFLGKSVTYKKSLVCIKCQEKKRGSEIILGRNFIVGDTTEELPMVRFQIEGVEEKDVKDYLEGGSIYKFILEIMEYLLPVEYEFDFKCKTKQEFSHVGFGILGYSSVLSS
ncbi:hypothetical protein BZG02_11840 [Labilibaculum filiforme]|uniref:Uncharacterized protein n=1 Tax=Labilibaculum filiforme TaxID=1940526 RepID=A0A2N3HXU2_9BACT|nr:hypothetical protein [Labilibaculum filiforme]PKQ62878.1 hypothetical protein BZG02_11840 [Labilibaculum filiforme]